MHKTPPFPKNTARKSIMQQTEIITNKFLFSPATVSTPDWAVERHGHCTALGH